MTTSRKKAPKPPPLRRGDVIKTHPREEFWGCAVVLTDPVARPGLLPLCHIAITPLVFTHDYEWPDVAHRKLSILHFDRGVRTAPLEYATRCEICIGQYVAYPHPLLPVIGSIDADSVFSTPLNSECGDGTQGSYPLCGRIAAHLGSEAVASWLQQHDPDRWHAELDAARQQHERLATRIKEEARQKRLARARRKADG